MKLTAVVLILASAAAVAQEKGLTARELYFRDDGPPARKKTTAPTTTAAAKPPVAVRRPKPAARPAEPAKTEAGPPIETVNAAHDPASSGVSIIPAAAKHLGLRYNVLRRAADDQMLPVDPDANFKAGDCLSLEVEANRDGYVYLFNRGTSGAWQALFPSAEMAEESNRLFAGEYTPVPEGFCFTLEDPPGKERLLVVFTEREEDMQRLGDSIRQRPTPAPAPAPAPRTGAPVMLAGGKLARDIEMLQAGQLIGRDIKITKIARPQAKDEKPNAVYAVRTASAAGDRLVVEISLKHE
ncbi:MAG: DUF4384 domain-containing protein [Bryobacterales bacterium]|nr:DUF4384 domain-containing protein [Bryobacterales bacterium]